MSDGERSRLSFLRSSGYATVTAGSAIMLVALTMIAGRWLPASEYGKFSFAIALATIIETLMDTGLGPVTVVLGLGLYSLTILVRSILDGLNGVPADVRESATGMGYAAPRLLFGVELPLALPTIMAGIRVATVSAVALTTVGAILDYGGLGDLLIAGKQSDFKAQVLVTSALCVLLAVVLDLLLVAVQRVLTPWTRKAATA